MNHETHETHEDQAKIICFAIVLTTTVLAHSQQEGPEWKARAVVIDQAGKPIEGADVSIGYYVPPPKGQSVATDAQRGKSDTNGVFTASGRTRTIDIFFSAVKEGFYKTRVSCELGATYQYDPVKWSPPQTLVLKPIRQPIPMYAKQVREQPPVNEQAVGYDLQEGDWVTPHGKGKRADMFFTVHHDRRAKNDWDYKLTVNFPNPGDGIQTFSTPVMPVGEGSQLRSPHEAVDAGYKSEWVKTQSRRPGQPSVYGIDKNLNFFLRVRTVLDEKGNVKSANYGKIYGDFMDFQYFFNPEPNSRNIEFDPAKNLSKNLGPSEVVRVP